MKIVLVIITVFCLVIGASINSLSLTIMEQIYAAMFYIMALMAFCTFALLFKGEIKWGCGWLRRECGLDDGDNKGTIEETLIVGSGELANKKKK